PPIARGDRLREGQQFPPQERLERAHSKAGSRYEDELSSPYSERDAANQGRSLKRRFTFEGDDYGQGRLAEKAQRSTYKDTRVPPPPLQGSTPRINEPSRPPLSDLERKELTINDERNPDGPSSIRNFESTAVPPRTSLPPQEELIARSRNGSVPPPPNQRRRYDDNERGRPQSRDNDGPNSGGSDDRRFNDWNHHDRSRSPRPFNNKNFNNHHKERHHNNNYHSNNNNSESNNNNNNREGGRGHWGRRGSEDRRPPFRRP